MFKKIRVTGFTHDWFTGRPVPSNVWIWSDNLHKEERLKMIDFDVNADGTFDREFRAGRTGRYHVAFSGDKVHLEIRRDADIADGSTFDFGKIEFEHRFFCKVDIKYTSGRNVSINFGAEPHGVSFGPGTNTVYLNELNLTEDEFNESRSYSLDYNIMGPSISEASTVIIPFGNSDTVSASVEF